MKIIDNRFKDSNFCELSEGDIFCAVFNDSYEYYIKIDTIGGFNAVNLTTGSCDSFYPSDPVALVDATLTIS